MLDAATQSQKRRAEFAELARRHETALMRCAVRLYQGNVSRAEDVVQETLIRAYQAYVAERFIEGKTAWPLLQRILTNLFINDYNHRRRWDAGVDIGDVDAGHLDPISQRHLALPEQPGAKLLAETLDEDLERALNSLPADVRETVVIVDVQGHSYDEAAQILGIPIGTVRSRLARGRMKMHDLLQEYGRRMGYAS
ncbi:MAG: sigma-70 family RNA polymerase sigma factor [Capsulimonadaceae bacterium]|nr:sigma-70 family RNA polymerase sigma factor [Capsulimonadaceae bacterium]